MMFMHDKKLTANTKIKTPGLSIQIYVQSLTEPIRTIRFQSYVCTFQMQISLLVFIPGCILSIQNLEPSVTTMCISSQAGKLAKTACDFLQIQGNSVIYGLLSHEIDNSFSPQGSQHVHLMELIFLKIWEKKFENRSNNKEVITKSVKI